MEQEADIVANRQRVEQRAVLKNHAYGKLCSQLWVIRQEAVPHLAQNAHLPLSKQQASSLKRSSEQCEPGNIRRSAVVATEMQM